MGAVFDLVIMMSIWSPLCHGHQAMNHCAAEGWGAGCRPEGPHLCPPTHAGTGGVTLPAGGQVVE